MLQLLTGLSPQHIQTAITTDTSIWQALPEEVRLSWRKKARPFRSQIKLFDQNSITSGLQRQRPDLWATIIATPGGRDWFTRLLDEMRRDLTLDWSLAV